MELAATVSVATSRGADVAADVAADALTCLPSGAAAAAPSSTAVSLRRCISEWGCVPGTASRHRQCALRLVTPLLMQARVRETGRARRLVHPVA